jgi:hypothetical protein
MNKIAQIRVFNNVLDNFLCFLEDEFAFFRSDIILTRNTIELIRRGNPRLIVEQFMKHVSPYSKQLFECDEDFFINFEKNISDSLSSDNFLLGIKLKKIWLENDTTDENKAKVFLYFQKLLKAGRLCLI